MMSDNSPPFRAGYVAIIGEPNVGKSTLMNGLLQQKISIVTAKPQTTRQRVLGILSEENYQIVFLDTPGLLKPAYLLQKAMMESARSAIDEADLILYMIDAKHPKLDETEILKKTKKPVFLVINKIDLIGKSHILPIIDEASKHPEFREIIPVSASTLDGLPELKKCIVGALPEHPPYYPTDAVSDQSERFFAAEIIREKIFITFRQEIPYSTTVEILEFREKEGHKDFISAEIYVERNSQKGILIGKGGEALKSVGELARKGIEEFLGRKVFLELHVKVRENWRNDRAALKRLGYGGL